MFQSIKILYGFIFLALIGVANSSLAADRVILISIDGLRPDIIEQLGADNLPGFYRFQTEGVWTNNARTDFDYTRTLPNHSSMMTSRGVTGDSGHGQIMNDMPAPTATLHNNSAEYGYIASVFDVTHDHGLTTALFVSKDKFALFEQSYNTQNGAPDTLGADNGRDKIDTYYFASPDRTATAMVDEFTSFLQSSPADFSFVHIVDTDSAGHGERWTTEGYQAAVRRVDSYLQKIFSVIDENPVLQDTAIILVADHGGTGTRHEDSDNPLNYTIPFYAWGGGIAPGKNIYELNAESRADPGFDNPDYTQTKQPIRNGDSGNLALSLLGLPAIPGSTINVRQDLNLGIRN